MATLNVKNLPDALYRRLQKRARARRRSVAQEVAVILDEALGPRNLLSITDLRGLGRETWRGVDAAAHVEAERRTWD